MIRNNKYLWNMGLAFDEYRVIKKMSELSKEGWYLKEMSLLKYTFEKAEPKELIYSMDYKQLKNGRQEYLQLFNESGWKHMCSNGPIHFFSASKGTVPIYTDKETYLGKYKTVRRVYFILLIISILSLVTIGFLNIFAANILRNKAINIVVLLVGMISAGIAAPSLMVTVAFLFKIKK